MGSGAAASAAGGAAAALAAPSTAAADGAGSVAGGFAAAPAIRQHAATARRAQQARRARGGGRGTIELVEARGAPGPLQGAAEAAAETPQSERVARVGACGGGMAGRRSSCRVAAAAGAFLSLSSPNHSLQILLLSVPTQARQQLSRRAQASRSGRSLSTRRRTGCASPLASLGRHRHTPGAQARPLGSARHLWGPVRHRAHCQAPQTPPTDALLPVQGLPEAWGAAGRPWEDRQRRPPPPPLTNSRTSAAPPMHADQTHARESLQQPFRSSQRWSGGQWARRAVQRAHEARAAPAGAAAAVAGLQPLGSAACRRQRARWQRAAARAVAAGEWHNWAASDGR